MFAAFVIPLGLLQLEFRPFDVRQLRRTLRLQVPVIQSAQQISSFDMVADVHRQFRNAAVDFRPHRHHVIRADVPAAFTVKVIVRGSAVAVVEFPVAVVTGLVSCLLQTKYPPKPTMMIAIQKIHFFITLEA